MEHQQQTNKKRNTCLKSNENPNENKYQTKGRPVTMYTSKLFFISETSLSLPVSKNILLLYVTASGLDVTASHLELFFLIWI